MKCVICHSEFIQENRKVTCSEACKKERTKETCREAQKRHGKKTGYAKQKEYYKRNCEKISLKNKARERFQYTKTCIICQNEFHLEFTPGRSHSMCSDECRKQRKKNMDKAREDKYGKYRRNKITHAESNSQRAC